MDEALASFSKEQLTNLVKRFSDSSYFPIALFILNADYHFSTTDTLKELWESAYWFAASIPRENDDMSAKILADCASALFERIKSLEDKEQRFELCQQLISDLQKAEEDDAIGSYTDSEWMYGEVLEFIEDYCSNN